MKTIKHFLGCCLSWGIEIWRKVRIFLLKTIFFFAPVKKNKVLFLNFNGRGYGCNPKYIAEEILNQSLNYDMVWLVSDLRERFPAGIRAVQTDSAKALYELATAKVIVDNVKNDLRLFKKKEQYVIQTWHGSYSAKYLEREAADTLSAKYLKESEANSKQTDLFLSNSRLLSQCYRDAFWCDCEILECGFPRNDMLFSKDPTVAKRIKGALGVSEETKLVLYAPTFRDDGSMDAYSIDCIGVLDALRQNGGDWKLLTRLHPNVAASKGLFPAHRDIIDATSYPDMQDLLFVSDVLITDYSSTVFEFAAMKKQIYIYAPDIDEYQKMRGLKPDFFKIPYTICQTNEQLIKLMGEYTPQSAAESAVRFMEIFGSVDKGDASKQVVQRISDVVSRA